jgi:hypothetical protein
VIGPEARAVLPNVIMQSTSPWILIVVPAPVLYCTWYCPFAASGVAGSVLSAAKE